MFLSCYLMMDCPRSDIDAEVRIISIVYDELASCYASMLYITNRKRGQTAVHISESRFGFALESSGDVMRNRS
jgi:hypothetical protein